MGLQRIAANQTRGRWDPPDIDLAVRVLRVKLRALPLPLLRIATHLLSK